MKTLKYAMIMIATAALLGAALGYAFPVEAGHQGEGPITIPMSGCVTGPAHCGTPEPSPTPDPTVVPPTPTSTPERPPMGLSAPLVTAEGCYLDGVSYWTITNNGSATLVTIGVNGDLLRVGALAPGESFGYVDAEGSRTLHLDLGGAAQWSYQAEKCVVELVPPVNFPEPTPEVETPEPHDVPVPIPPAAGNAGLKAVDHAN